MGESLFEKKNNYTAPFDQFVFQPLSPQEFLLLFDGPLKTERLSQPSSYLVILKPGSLDQHPNH